MNASYKRYASVLLDLGLKNSFSYGIEEKYLDQLEKGMCVKVPLRGVLQTGIVVEFSSKCPYKKVLPIHSIVSEKTLMTPELFKLAQWVSQYYHTPLARTLKLFFPKSVRKGMGHKKQQVVIRKKSLEELRQICMSVRLKKPKQAALIDELLKVEKEIFLTELTEKAGVSRSVVATLAKQELIELTTTRVDRNPLEKAEYFPSKPKKLNSDQQNAYNQISHSIENTIFQSFLLFGVTGSGKTEVYMQAMESALKQGKKALMLVPEIALTTQTVEKLKSRFKDKIAILHHRLSQGERYDQWHAIRQGLAPIVIGARSAIFAPIDKLGVIIVDEEHELSYKQTDDMPTYNARDVAVVRAKMNNATVVLGSATPSLESFNNVQNGKYKLLELKNRANSQVMPKIEVVDMKREMERSKGFTLFSQKLLSEIEKRFQKGEQSIIFLNRRGYHTSLLCTQCGEVEKCPNCDISLTFHRKNDCLACHLCDYRITPPKICSKCKSATIKFKGFGTENVESQLRKIFPSLRTLRMDADTTKHVGSYEKLYYAFRNHKADLLIGTQMVAKGLHFPSVTLVGILNCDRQFNIPDFKGSEIGFQMVTQVSGRAGRGDIKGSVVIQSFNPENSFLNHAISGDYLAFYNQEIESRKFFNYSPFSHLVKLVFRGKSEGQTLRIAQQFYNKLKMQLARAGEAQAPLPCGYPKIKEYYRFQVLLKGQNIYALIQALQKVEEQVHLPSTVKLLTDVDPSSTFF
ncbi:MAG: Primosomal protein N' [Chlamydiae bacterium]|nr:Primosomal protein N' [Chlamydiota bacterium]